MCTQYFQGISQDIEHDIEEAHDDQLWPVENSSVTRGASIISARNARDIGVAQAIRILYEEVQRDSGCWD
jgi:hypothetical protein